MCIGLVFQCCYTLEDAVYIVVILGSEWLRPMILWV